MRQVDKRVRNEKRIVEGDEERDNKRRGKRVKRVENSEVEKVESEKKISRETAVHQREVRGRIRQRDREAKRVREEKNRGERKEY